MSEFLVINKPVGPTSHDVVDRVRKLTGERRVGHAGTLDPLASGVLVVGVGREATKQLAEIVQKEKEYLAEVTLGQTSTTDDEQGEKTVLSTAQPSVEALKQAIVGFVGNIEQVPPAYSALKINGQSAHYRVRAGEEVTMQPRPALIKEIELLDYGYPKVKLRVVTGPGVYIRALARDIGAKLEVGGYLSALQRTRVGQFSIKDALSYDELKPKIDNQVSMPDPVRDR